MNAWRPGTNGLDGEALVALATTALWACGYAGKGRRAGPAGQAVMLGM